MADLRDFVARHGLAALALLVWAMLIVSFATWHVFTNLEKVSLPVATAYGSLLAIPSAIIPFIRWRFSKEGDDK